MSEIELHRNENVTQEAVSRLGLMERLYRGPHIFVLENRWEFSAMRQTRISPVDLTLDLFTTSNPLTSPSLLRKLILFKRLFEEATLAPKVMDALFDFQ